MEEALRAGAPLNRLYVDRDLGESRRLRALMAEARQRRLPVERVPRQRLDALTDVHHQGILATAAPVTYVGLDDVLAIKSEEPLLLLLLDGVEDPQNLGSLVRSADAAGVHAVIIGARRAAQVTEAVERASAGATEHMTIARVSSMAQTVAQLKDAGIWTAAADPAGGKAPWREDLKGPLALVVGSEGRGVSQLVRERCDYRLSLPMRGNVGSLNAAVAGAVLLFEVRRQRELG